MLFCSHLVLAVLCNLQYSHHPHKQRTPRSDPQTLLNDDRKTASITNNSIIEMAPDQSPAARPLANDPEPTPPPQYERRGTFNFLQLPREIRDLIYAEVADPNYNLDTALAATVSYMRTKSSIENYQKLASSSSETNSSNINDKVDNKPTNPNNLPNYPNLDSPSHPALSLNNLHLHPLAQTNPQIRREYLSTYFATPTFTLPIAVCALQAPHPPAPYRICGKEDHHKPITRHYYASEYARCAAGRLDSSPLNDKPVLRHQHFKVTVLTDYNDTTTRPLHSLRRLGRRNQRTTRVEWESFVDVFFHKGELSVEGDLVGEPVAVGEWATTTARAREATEERAQSAFEKLKADLKRTCAGGRIRTAAMLVPPARSESWKDELRCPPNSPVLGAVAWKSKR